MGYTPLVRWRNFTLENLKTILEIYPDMTSTLSRSEALDIIEQKLSGYKRTAYQFACQLGLECRGDKFKVQNYLFTFDDDNLIKYLNFWFKMYVTPNPYINSNEAPISIFKALAEEILSTDNKQISFNSFCVKYFGEGKSSDILKNAIQAYGDPIVVDDDILYLPENKTDELMSILSKVNDTLPMKNNLDREEFFQRFSYEQFCKFYDIPYSKDVLENLENINMAVELEIEKNRVSGGSNILLYGVPGSGKSWTIEHEYCKKDSNVERLVFHPDYTYSDFVGQILPDVSDDGQVSYKFTPGPFTTILRDAYVNPQKEYILIIEEINRGNAPAIFGEVFQLLDRKVRIKEEDDDDVFPIGTSEYGITNKNIALEVYGDARHKVRIPSNLTIIGTMNTSDQNVFTLDTAFQRRWEMRMIENSFDRVDPKFANAEILDTTVTWKNFCVAINDIIVGNNARMTSAEDKRLGAYFVHLRDLEYNDAAEDKTEGEYDNLCKKEKERTLTSDEKKRLEEIRDAMKHNRRFPEKVIKYLWDDAFKFSREVVFETNEYQSLEAVIRKFMQAKKFERFAIFKQNVRDAFINQNNIE
ncbi:McrB family protein [Clostridium prolinivorans]|uniref:McrB family protein n=1 Tax=Clostridium prolinivorans TaxID=2769420 RepID=UPI001D191CC3|nr:AAA family ATPase [Clostridium prolinivorans]